jgi:hypothetical protein
VVLAFVILALIFVTRHINSKMKTPLQNYSDLVVDVNRPQFRIEYFVFREGRIFPAVTFVACPTVEDAFSIVSGEVDFRSIPVVRSKGMFCFFNGIKFTSVFQ